MDDPAQAPPINRTFTGWHHVDPLIRHNLRVETLFSAFNGVYMGLAILAAPVIAVEGVQASPLELTVLISAFPVGAFLGPLWAGLGRRWGMQRLVVQMAIWANLPLFLLYWVHHSALFTLLITLSQLLNSAMRMGQSTLYRHMYPHELRGRALGKLTFWTYLTMVPSILVAGWLLDHSREAYRVLYPVAGLCGLIGCLYYRQLHVPGANAPVKEVVSIGESLRGVETILARDRAYLLFQLSFFLSGSSVFMSTHVVLLLVKERFPFNALELALSMSVVPQLLLALGSPVWGRVLDRVGIIRCRLLISGVLTTYLASYYLGILGGWAVLIWAGSVLQGVCNGGGQLTWALASSHFAPRPEDVPLYNGIHFVLNGIRGLILPWVGSVLFVLTRDWAVLIATLVSLASIPALLCALRVVPAHPPH